LPGGLVGNGIYAFDGSNGRYEIIYDADTLVASTKTDSEEQTSSNLSCFRALTDGAVTLIDLMHIVPGETNITHGPQITHPGAFYRSFLFPLSLGQSGKTNFDLSDDIKNCLDGTYSLSVVRPHEMFSGHEVLYFAFAAPNGTRQYWVDMSRGATPLQVRDELHKGGRAIQWNCDDVRYVDEAGWLPHVLTETIQDGRLVRRVEITSSNTESLPGKDVFTLMFPEKVSIFDMNKKWRYQPRTNWSLIDSASYAHDSPGVPKPNLEHLDPEPPLTPDAVESPDWSSTLYLVPLILIAFGLAIGNSKFFRNRKS